MSNPLGRLTAEEVILTLCSMLECDTANTVLILEDLHYIESREIDLLLDLLIKRSPDNLQLTISSRDYPTLPISTLRAQERLLQITSTDLRFVEQEICEFLQLDAADNELRFAEDKSEGWAIALQLMRLHRQEGKEIPKSLGTIG